MAKMQDQFCSILHEEVTMSATDTITFQEINIGLNLFDKVGLILHKIAYAPVHGSLNQLVAAADELNMALCTDDQLTGLAFDQVEVIDNFMLQPKDIGTVAELLVYEKPFFHDFSTMPGGGIIVAPKPLYLGMNTTGFTSAGQGKIRLYFTIRKLADADYLELLQTRRGFA